MKIEVLIEEFRGKENVRIGENALEGLARALEQVIGTPGVQLEKARVEVRGGGRAKPTQAGKQKLLLYKTLLQARTMHQRIEHDDELANAERREALEKVEWALVQSLQRLGFIPKRVRARDAATIYQSTLRISDRKLARRYRLARRGKPVPRSMSITGTHVIRTDQGTFPIEVTADFFELDGQLGFLLLLDKLPESIAARVLFGLDTGAWRPSLRVARPRLLLSSMALRTRVEDVVVPLQPGLNFAVRFAVGANVARVMGNPPALVLAGPLRYEHGRPAPTLDLSTYPKCTLALRDLRLTQGFLSLRSAWASMDAAPDLPDTAPEAAELIPPPAEHVRMMEVGLAGTYSLGALNHLRLWSSLPADTGVLVFNKYEVFEVFPATVEDLSSLDALLGGSDWRTGFPNQDLLADARPYTVRNLTPFHDLQAQRVTSITVELTSKRDLRLPGLEGFVLGGLTLTFVVSFPHGGGTRSVYTTGSAKLLANGLQFDATLDVPSLRIDASSEGGALSQEAVGAAAFLRGLVLAEAGRDGARYTNFYLGLEPTQAGYVVAGFAATNDDGDEREWRRRG